MTTARKNLLVFALAFGAVALPSFLYIQQHAFDEEAFNLVLRISARLAILIYLLIFVARPLRQLTGSGLSKHLLKNRRQIGVTLAAVMSAHLLYLLWKNGFVFPFFGALIYAFIFLMLITSFEGPTKALGPKNWKMLHKTGLYALGIALAQAQFGRIIHGMGAPIHYLLAALFIAAIAVRMLAWRRQRLLKN